jgi:hypothetical protein
MSESEERLRKKTQREERLRKKTLRQRHQQFIKEDAARQLSSRENDRLGKEKAAEQRVWDEVKAQRKKDKARQEVVYVYSDEDSETESDEDNDEDLDKSKDTDWNTCLSLSCLVVLFLSPTSSSCNSS